MKHIKKLISDESGSVAVVEAAFVYPVVILTVVLMIYMGVYALETSLLRDRAENAAVMAGRAISFAGYDKLYDMYSGYTDFDPSKTDEPALSQVNSAYGESAPYRYIVTPDMDNIKESISESLESELLAKQSSAECTVNIERHILSRKVTVRIRKKISMPQIFEYLNLNDDYNINVSASALTSDPAEFIRNTDITVSFAGFLAEKFHFKDKLSGVCEKLSGFLSSFKIPGVSE